MWRCANALPFCNLLSACLPTTECYNRCNEFPVNFPKYNMNFRVKNLCSHLARCYLLAWHKYTYIKYKTAQYTILIFVGVLKSPGFPGEYPPDQSCLWLLHTNQDAEIQLFCDLIELQDCVVSVQYRYHFILDSTWQGHCTLDSAW